MQDTLEYVIGSRVRCAGDECGEVDFVVVDPVADQLTHLVVRPDDDGGQARLVPVHIAVPGPDGVDLNCTRARFDEFEPAVRTYFLPEADAQIGASVPRGDRVLAWPLYGLAMTPTALTGFVPGVDPQLATATVEHIPAGEVGIRRGEPVHADDGGEIGRVQGLVVAPPDSEVTHVLLDEGHLWGRKRVAIPIEDVTGIDVDGVAVGLTKDEIKNLPPVDIEGPAAAAGGG